MSLSAFVRVLGLLVSLCSASCADEPDFPRAETRAPSARQSAHVATPGAPLLAAQLTASEAFVPGRPLRLVLRLERRLALSAQVLLSLKLPEGVHLLEGVENSALSGCANAQTDTRTFLIRADGLPSNDLALGIDVQSPAYGYHGRLHYRFGRADPVPADIVPRGAEVWLHGRGFGRSLDATSTLHTARVR